MKIYCCDLGWMGGVAVMAENREKAMALIMEKSHHKISIKERNIKVEDLEELEPCVVYDFLGDS